MKKQLFLVLLLSLPSLNLFASLAEQKGMDIALEADRRDEGFGDFTADLKMLLIDQKGNETLRSITRKTLEVEGDGNKSLDIFHLPKDVRGTAVLTYSHGLEPDDQWIYLPALKRTKRISSVNKSGPFMGSEFAYEDIASQEVEKFTYHYLRDEALEGHDCFVRENRPRYEYSGYTRQIEWMDKEIYQPRKVVYYDRKNELYKTLVFRDYKQYLGKYWRPGEMIMDNHQTGKRTIIKWDNYRFRVGLSDRDFSRPALKRVR
jgi:outer membrane lipoprotein-sorting protein